MKKKAIVIVSLVVAVLAVVAVLLFMNAPVEIPSKEMAYLQLDTKGEEFVLEQIKGVPRERLIECWGEPDGGLFGFFGDIWEISEDECIVVYYSDKAEVKEIRLNRENKDNDDNEDNSPVNYGIVLSAENVSDTGLTLVFESTVLPAGSISIGRDFAIQIFENGEWKDLEPKTEPVFLTDALVPMDNKWSMDIDWEWLYGKLPAGAYRISQSVRVSTGIIGTSASYQEEEAFELWTQFDVDQNTEPSETDIEAGDGDDLVAPPSNNTEYDRNFSLGSNEMKWNYFDDSWSFALRSENQTPEGITLVHSPASDTKDVVLEHGQEYFLESWDGECWNLLFTGTLPSESPEAMVFSGNVIMEPIPVQLNWGAQYGALGEGKYRVGMYYTVTRSSGEQETNLCYAKFLVNGTENDSLVKKCDSALKGLRNWDTYHIQRTDYMLEHRDEQDSQYYVSDVWKSGRNYYSEVTYFYNSNGEVKSALGMLLRDGKGYGWNTLQSPDKLWSEKDLTDRSFQMWAFGMDCTSKTLEKVTENEDSIAFVFSNTSTFSGQGKIQKKVLTYYFNQNDELARVTVEYVFDNQEKMLEADLVVKNDSSEQAENVIREQNVTAAPMN